MREYLGNQKDRIICDTCDIIIGIDEGDGELASKYEGVNNGEHECWMCKESRKSRYDDYVDPLHAYH